MNGNARTTAPSKAPTVIAGHSKSDRMVTLVCSSCRMALYMSDKKLHEPSWQCPSCDAVTRT